MFSPFFNTILTFKVQNPVECSVVDRVHLTGEHSICHRRVRTFHGRIVRVATLTRRGSATTTVTRDRQYWKQNKTKQKKDNFSHLSVKSKFALVVVLLYYALWLVDKNGHNLIQRMQWKNSKPIVTRSNSFSCAWRRFFVFASGSDWFIALFSFVVIDQRDWFWS